MKPATLTAASPFDQAAENYDRDFTATAIGLLQRKRVQHFLQNILSGSSALNILEINCGTGEDAMWLAKQGHGVLATDASAGMIDAASKKYREERTYVNLNFQVIAFNNLLSELKDNRYDLIFSDFGGLNCISHDEMGKLAGDIRKLLKPGGKFAAVVMGRKCLWETGYFLLKGKWKQAFRRMGLKAVRAPVGTALQDTWYFSPTEIKKLFSKEMSCMMLKPVGIALPPSYLEIFFQKKPGFLSFLNRLENESGFSVMADFADHFFIVLEKNKNKQEIQAGD
jgi:ubiquinone/menaquinone biosynthesis C-methylase UbiE